MTQRIFHISRKRKRSERSRKKKKTSRSMPAAGGQPECLTDVISAVVDSHGRVWWGAASYSTVMPVPLLAQPHWGSGSDLASQDETQPRKHGFSFFFFPTLSLYFTSEIGSPVRVTAELHHCARTTVRDVHISTGWEQGRWIHLCENKVQASSPCQRQIYLGLEEFINEQVKPSHISLSGDKATSRAVLHSLSNTHFQRMNE